jgi:coproporphyrinogen III oxidase-like Fe-S oxidoreductase
VNFNVSQFLGRKHTSVDSIRAIESAKSLYDRVSVDLIYARHSWHKEEDWRQELKVLLLFFAFCCHLDINSLECSGSELEAPVVIHTDH